MLSVMNRQEVAQCSKSPTFVHHFLIPTLGIRPVGICKWCKVTRGFDNISKYYSWEEARAGALATVVSTKDRT